MSPPLQIRLPPDLSDAIVRAAARQGIEPEALVLDTLRNQFLGGTAPASPANAASPPPRTLADRLAKYIGAVDSSERMPGGSNLAQESEKVFGEIVAEKHARQTKPADRP